MATTTHKTERRSVLPQMGLTFEQVWAALMETRARQEKTDEQIRKTDEQMQKTDEQMQKTDARIDKLSKNVGGLNRSVGELIETLIAARLWEKFDTYSYNFRRAYQRIPLFDETDRRLTDIDVLLVNGEYVMAVEVKRELDSKKDVDHHLNRMELILKYAPDQCKEKKLLGAMAGGTVDPDVQAYAHSVGFFVLELTGESVRLAETPKEFEPRQW
jgi:predicted RNase H-like nuclease (RuvC/YqgF family)